MKEYFQVGDLVILKEQSKMDKHRWKESESFYDNSKKELGNYAIVLKILSDHIFQVKWQNHKKPLNVSQYYYKKI